MTDSATVVEFEPALVAVTIEALTVPPGWRIQPFGDSFVILPPEECQS